MVASILSVIYYPSTRLTHTIDPALDRPQYMMANRFSPCLK